MYKSFCSSAPVGGDNPDFENCVLPKHNLNQEIAKKNDMKAYEKKEVIISHMRGRIDSHCCGRSLACMALIFHR